MSNIFTGVILDSSETISGRYLVIICLDISMNLEYSNNIIGFLCYIFCRPDSKGEKSAVEIKSIMVGQYGQEEGVGYQR